MGKNVMEWTSKWEQKPTEAGARDKIQQDDKNNPQNIDYYKNRQ